MGTATEAATSPAAEKPEIDMEAEGARIVRFITASRNRIAELEKENETLEEKVSELDDKVIDLEQEPEEDPEIVKAVEMYADPANWTDEGRFAPVATWIDVSDPYLPARRALDLYNK